MQPELERGPMAHPPRLTLRATDGTEMRADVEGHGPVILVVHPGLDDGSMWTKPAAELAQRFQVVRIHRRQYRADLKADGRPCSIAQEVDDVLALARALGKPSVIVGHSSGGVVALEALAAAPPGTFSGAVIYEPPVVIDEPLGGRDGRVLAQARAAIAANNPGRAITLFLRDVVKVPPALAWVAGLFARIAPRLRALAPLQIDDLEAIDQLGVRLAAYARIDVAVVLLGGERSPSHLAERLDALGRKIPRSERLEMRGVGHDANRRAVGERVRIIGTLADEVLR